MILVPFLILGVGAAWAGLMVASGDNVVLSPVIRALRTAASTAMAGVTSPVHRAEYLAAMGRATRSMAETVKHFRAMGMDSREAAEAFDRLACAMRVAAARNRPRLHPKLKGPHWDALRAMGEHDQ